VEGEELSQYVLYVASVLEEELFVAILRGQSATEKKWEGEPGLEAALYYSRWRYTTVGSVILQQVALYYSR
jgi:hypothetical protein